MTKRLSYNSENGFALGGADAFFGGKVVFTPNEVTYTTTQTLSPTATFYMISTGAALTLTLGTDGCVAGQLLILYGVSAQTITIADTNLLSSTGSTISVGQYDTCVLIFNGTAWVELLLIADS